MDLDELFLSGFGFHSGYPEQLDQVQSKLG
jgi:hypothetical protein